MQRDGLSRPPINSFLKPFRISPRNSSPLQEARHRADYDTEATIKQAEADTNVMRAEMAFLDWETVQRDPSADSFLAELLCRSIPKR